MIFMRFAIANALWIAIQGMAAAAALPDPEFGKEATAYDALLDQTYDPCGGECGGVGTLGVGTPGVGGSRELVSISNPNQGPLTIFASSSGRQAWGGYSTGGANFYLELVGPPPIFPGATILIRADINMHAAVSLSNPTDGWAQATAFAQIDIENPIGQPIPPMTMPSTFDLSSIFDYGVSSEILAGAGPVNESCGDPRPACVNSADFDGTLGFALQPNVVYSISLGVVAQTEDYNLDGNPIIIGTSSQSAEASIDPRFYIDPIYIDIPYELELSEGVSNYAPGTGAGGVPEPSIWALFGLGFGFVAMLRARVRGRELRKRRA
jgi:hypothetical protein